MCNDVIFPSFFISSLPFPFPFPLPSSCLVSSPNCTLHPASCTSWHLQAKGLTEVMTAAIFVLSPVSGGKLLKTLKMLIVVGFLWIFFINNKEVSSIPNQLGGFM